MSNPTAGPWRVGDAGFTVFGPPNGTPTPESITSIRKKANARLIAAAPDMLEALYNALPYVEDALDDNAFKPGVVAGHVSKIRAAIAKAEGTTP